MPGTKNFLTQIRLSLHIVASLNIPMPFLCISWHCPSLPLHIGAAHPPARPRLTFSFRSVPIQCLSLASRPFTFPLPLRTSICTAFPLRTRASTRGSMPLLCRAVRFFAIPMHRQSTRRLSFPLHNPTIRYCTMPLLIFASPCVASPLLFSARPRLALPLQHLDTLYTVPLLCISALPLRLCMATRFSTNPLHLMRNKAVPQQNLATLRLSFASPCVSMLCDAVAIQSNAEPLRSLASPGFSVHRHCFTSQSQPSQSLCCAAPCQCIALQFISIPLPDDALLLCASPLLLVTEHDRS